MAIQRNSPGKIGLSNFAKDVLEGLNDQPKRLPSKYFYDQKGDELFIKIMNMPTYYLTDCEMEIFSEQAHRLIELLQLNKQNRFELIELGAGDGSKTFHLLHALLKKDYTFNYVPIDISSNSLDTLSNNLTPSLPNLNITPIAGDYFLILDQLSKSQLPKVVLFLGSNIGNMNDEKASGFIQSLSKSLNKKDQLVLGADLIKSKHIVLPAYNDPEGITAAFNLNLLERINMELGGNFILSNFKHTPNYNEQTGITTSGLTSLVNQQVFIAALEKTFTFQENEMIHTEISRKYNDDILNKIIQHSQLYIKAKLTDSKAYFADYILEKRT